MTKLLKTKAVVIVAALLASLVSTITPANAITGITPSAAGPFTFTVGTAITPISFAEAGAVGDTTYTVNNPLPAGLSIDAASGTISGTPTAATATANYVITASDAGDNPATTSTSTLSITVQMAITPTTQTVTATAGSAITSTTAFTVTGGTGTIEYTLPGGVSLPAGLSLNASTGVISGTPQIAQASTNYTITATDDNNFTRTSTVAIAVNAVITPATQTMTGVAGTAITASTPYTTAGFTGLITYAAVNALPAGLTINANSGVISGTPTAAAAQANYTIRATDSLNKTATATVTITISAAAITPATQTLLATAGTAITPTTAFTPAGFTGAITYAVNPALPAGLTLNTSTGVISGTPTGNQAATVHTITATGATTGTATATITITVSAKILPTTQTLSVVAGSAITPTTAFSATGFTGTVVYSVSPALPAGLVMNTTNGQITGTPTVSQAATTYTITATGTTAGSTQGTGSATATIAITIGSSIAPLTKAVNLTLGVAMTPTSAYTLNGFSGVISYSIAPVLPAGLILNTTTGVITGTPAVLVAPSNYVITVRGSTAGLGTTTVTLAVYVPLAAPAGVTATPGDRTVTVTWNPVVGATSYQVVTTPAGGSCAVSATQAVCSNLVNNTSYTFRVTAVNQAGPAALSTTSSAVTPKAPFKTVTGKLTIYYSPSGSVIPSKSLTKIKAIGSQFKAAKGTNGEISVRGFITKKSPTALDKRLSSVRATLVARALKNAGLSGKYTTVANAQTSRTGKKARKVVVKYTYQTPN